MVQKVGLDGSVGGQCTNMRSSALLKLKRDQIFCLLHFVTQLGQFKI